MRARGCQSPDVVVGQALARESEHLLFTARIVRFGDEGKPPVKGQLTVMLGMEPDDSKLVENKAAAHNIALRSGCFCNPGIVETALLGPRDMRCEPGCAGQGCQRMADWATEAFEHAGPRGDGCGTSPRTRPPGTPITACCSTPARTPRPTRFACDHD